MLYKDLTASDSSRLDVLVPPDAPVPLALHLEVGTVKGLGEGDGLKLKEE